MRSRVKDSFRLSYGQREPINHWQQMMCPNHSTQNRKLDYLQHTIDFCQDFLTYNYCCVRCYGNKAMSPRQNKSNQKKKMKKNLRFCFSLIISHVLWLFGTYLAFCFRCGSFSMGAENAAISPKSVERIRNHFLKRHAILCFSSDQTETS